VIIIDRHDPGIITINSVISALQSHEVVKIIHWKKGHKGLGEPVSNYVIFNAMTMKLYHIEKVKNPDCIQCGKKKRRVVIKMKPNSICMNIIKTLEKNGFQLESDLEPIITLLDFNEILILDLEKNYLKVSSCTCWN
ncbi:unnamed protein product, partial [marine sediment metagenome]